MRVRNATVDPIVKRLRAFITAYDGEVAKKWHPDGEKVVKRYKDDRAESQASVPRFNVLWSNVETLKPFLYSSTPKPIVSTRHDDAGASARLAAEVLERALAYTIAEGHFGTTLRNARDDYLLPGRGTAWVRYKPTFVAAASQVSESEVSDDPAQKAVSAGKGEDGTEQIQEVVGWEETVTDYVHWRDFGHNIAPTWEEVDVVWRCVPMDRDALKERFGEEIGGKVPLDYRQRGNSTAKAGEDDTERAGVYECWWKSKRKVFWITKTHPEPLDEKDDPLKLDHFFPCPRPIYATITTDSLIPTPDFVQYRDQANEIDDLTARIAALTSAVKAAGVYDADVPALKTLLSGAFDNVLIPVESFAALKEKGGLKGAVELLPMADIVQTLIALHDAREKQKADLYEVTGMSDIVRGNTAPDETATAQKIKSNFATKRLAERQSAVERFASNIIAIMGNIIAVHFSVDTLIAMTGMKLLTEQQKAQVREAMAQQQAGPAPMGHNGGPPMAPPPPAPGAPPAPAPPPPAAPTPDLPQDAIEALDKPSWEEVMDLLQNEPQRRFAISVESDSLVAGDDAEEQAARSQFLEAVGGFLQQAMQAVEQQPAMAPLLGHMLMFAVRGFRVGRDLDDVFQQFVDKMEEQAKQPQPPKPDPAMAKVNGELQLAQAQQQFEQQRATAQDQHAQQMQLSDQQHRQQMDIAASQRDHASAAADAQNSAAQAHIDAALERMKAEMQQQTAALIAHIQNLGKIEVARITADASADAQAEAHEEEQGA